MDTYLSLRVFREVVEAGSFVAAATDYVYQSFDLFSI